MGHILRHHGFEGGENDRFVAPPFVWDAEGKEHKVRWDFRVPLERRVHAFAQGGVELQRASHRLTSFITLLKKEHEAVYNGLDGLVGILESVQEIVHALSTVRNKVRESLIATTDGVSIHRDAALQEPVTFEEPEYQAPTTYQKGAVALCLSDQLERRVQDYIAAVISQCASGIGMEEILYALHQSHPTEYAIVMEQHGLKELLLAVLSMDEMEGVRQW